MARDRIIAIVASIAAILIGVVCSLTEDEPAGGSGDFNVTVVDGPCDAPGVTAPHGLRCPTVVQADPGNELEPDESAEAVVGTESEVLPAASTPDVHEDARDETPLQPGVENGPPEAKVEAPGVAEPVDLLGAQVHSCKRRYVRNQSARNGPVSMIVLHITVGGTLDSIYQLFNTPSFGASSTYGMSLEGKCENWVPVDRKPWTQLAFNSASESIEITTFLLTREQWKSHGLIKNGVLASLVADRLKARGLPPKFVNPVGCFPQAGFTDHLRLECGNLHVDVGDGFPWKLFARQVRRFYYGGAAHPVSAAALRQCRQLNRYRRQAVAAHGWKNLPDGARHRAGRLAGNLDRHKYVCQRRGQTTVIRRK